MHASRKHNAAATAAARRWPSDCHRINARQHARLVCMLNDWAGDRPVVQGIHTGHRSWAQVAAPKVGDQIVAQSDSQKDQLSPFMLSMYNTLEGGKVSVAAMMSGSEMFDVSQVPMMFIGLAQQAELGNIGAMTGLQWLLSEYDVDEAAVARCYHQGLYASVEAWLSLPWASVSKLAAAVWSK